MEQLCSCSKEEVNRHSYEQVVPCPAWAPKKCPNNLTTCMHLLGSVVAHEYVSCTNDGDEYSDPDFARAVCCGTTPPRLPQCQVETRSWKGGVGIAGGVAAYRAAYGDQVRLVPVTPDGGICGEWTTRQEITPCCDVAAPVTVVPHDAVLAPEGLLVLRTGQGVPPFSWQPSGGLTLVAVSADTRIATVRAEDSFCGTGEVVVTDACSTEAAAMVRSTVGMWVEIPWPTIYTLPPGFVPGPTDDSVSTPVCTTSSIPYIRTSGRWRIRVAYGVVGFLSGGCPAVPGNAGAITLLAGLGMSPCQYFCARYACGGAPYALSGDDCCAETDDSPSYGACYQAIVTVYEWRC